MNIFRHRELPVWLYTILPIALFASPYIISAFFSEFSPVFFAKESGIVENLTVGFLLFAIVYTLLSWSEVTSHNIAVNIVRLLKLWLIVYLFGCIYYLGEEISWGQHLFNWATPDAWLKYNDQQETNLHNTLGIFDQVPRAIVTVTIVIGGVLMPLYRNIKSVEPDRKAIDYWVMPTATLLPSSLTVFLLSVHDKVFEPIGYEVPAFMSFEDGEVKELLIAAVFLLYIMSLRARLKSSEKIAVDKQ